MKYEVNVPKDGTYNFWTRKFWRHGEFRWRFDDQQWQHCGTDCVLADSTQIRPLLPANWVPLGQTTLTAGKHLLTIQTTDTVLEKPAPPPVKPLAPTVTKDFDWCTVTYPKEVAVGQKVPIKVAYHGIKEKLYLMGGFHWMYASGNHGGLMAESDWNGPVIQGDGEATITVPVQNTAGKQMATVVCNVYASPDKTWAKRVKYAQIKDIPIDPDSIRPVVKGAGAMCFDCFLLTTGSFTPRGKLKPGEKSGLAMPGYFAFEPDRDTFRDDAVLDLRGLNEKVAGESGWVTRKGDRFYLGNGKEVKFWATTINNGATYTKQDIAYMMRRFAKLGMNMVRIYRPPFDASGNDLDRLDPKQIDIYQYITSQAKKNGMYVSFNIYWSKQLSDMDRFGFKGWSAEASPWMLHIWDDRMREYTKTWVRKLMTAPNPYGPPLGRDPAVAMVQIQSEDTVFFYTTNPRNYPEGFWHDRIGKLFGDWLTKKYGSIEKAYDAWGGGKLDGDDPAAGIAMPLAAGALSGGRGAAHERRVDNARFYAERQQDYYRELVDTYRSTGYKGLIVCQGFKTANDAVLGNFEQWTNAAGDATDLDHYFACIHVGPRTSYAVDKGDYYRAYSALNYPTSTVLRYKTAKDLGAIVDEFGWTSPSPYMAEAPFLISCYGDLLGIDCYQWFTVNAVGYDTRVAKFPWSTPELMGQMPATALIYRRGYVKESAPVVLETFDPKTADLRPSKYYNSGGGDPTRGYVKDERGVNQKELRNALTFLVGKVETSFDPKDKPFEKDVSACIDMDAKTVRSDTGELAIDYGKGLGTVNTPCAQGASGFLGKVGRVDLGDVAIQSRNDFSTVLVVSMDGKPLAESGKVLIQAATHSRPYGWTEKPAKFSKGKATYEGKQIVSLGDYPLNVEKVSTQVILKGRGAPKKAMAVDPDGYAMGNAECHEAAGALSVTLPADALYTVVEF